MPGKILLIIIDQFRADCLNGALADSVELPNLRSLMAESVTFDQHYTVATPCGPARASLLTGLYAMNHRSVRNGTPLDETLPTLGTQMRLAGYEPMLFGYTDTSADPRRRFAGDPDLKNYEGLAPGFAEIVRVRLEQSGSWHADLKAKGYDVPQHPYGVYRASGNPTDTAHQISNPAIYSAADSDTAFLTEQTMRELSVREDRDWFAMVSYLRPHPPLVAPEPYNTMYDPGSMPPPVGTSSIAAHRQAHPYFDAFFAEPYNFDLFIGFDGHFENLDANAVSRLRAIYLGLASEVDHHIGRLIGYLKATGQYDDTLIVITGDHAEMLGDHFMWGKRAMYEGALKVPLIIRDPQRRSTAGQCVGMFTESIDVAPTLFDHAGIAIPPGVNGRSLIPFLDGQAPALWRDHVFAEIDYGQPHKKTEMHKALDIPFEKANLAMIRTDRFKYVHYNGGLPPLLYDMKNDPGEVDNLAGNPDHAATLLDMAQRMIDHRMTHADQKLSRMALTDKGVQTG